MKKALWYVFALLVSALIVAALPISGEEKIYENVIRLHVIAASDSEEDQRLKLRVRDEILRRYSAELGEVTGVQAAEDRVQTLRGEIEACAAEVVREAGYAYTVKVTYGDEEYPERCYGEYTFPSGTYRSLRVVIDRGEGQNWWCVLYPPLCLDLATDEAPKDDALAVGLSAEEYRVISGSEGGYVIKFKALELLEGVFGHRRK